MTSTTLTLLNFGAVVSQSMQLESPHTECMAVPSSLGQSLQLRQDRLECGRV